MSRTRTLIKPQSHNGCYTCKARKVKCDEGRPICQRCLKGARTCDGYRDTDSSEEIVLRCPARTTREAHIDGDLTGQLEALRLSDLCCQVLHSSTASRCSIASNFWSSTVPQLSQQSRVVRLATITLGAAIQAQYLPQQSTILALAKYYGQAVRNIQDELAKSEGLPVPLAAACLLLASADVLCSRETQALAHLQGTLALLRKRQSSLKKDNVWLSEEVEQFSIDDEVDAAAAILDVGTATYVLGEDCRLPGLYTDSFCKNCPGSISGIAKLEAQIIQVLHDSYNYANSLGSYQFVPFTARPPSIATTQGRHIGHLLRLIQELTYAIPGFSGPQRRRALVLRMHCRSALIHVATRTDPSQCGYDAFIADFRSIVQDAESWAHEDASSTDQHGLDPPFISILPDIGIIGPLFEVAAKCRHPHVRRRAIALLTQNRYEGPWGSKKMARVACRALMIEEEQTLLLLEDFKEDMPLSTFLPESSRLTAIGVDTSARTDNNTEEVIAIFRQYTGPDNAMRPKTGDEHATIGQWREWREHLSLRTPILVP